MEGLDSKQKQSLSVLSLGSIMWLDAKWTRLLQISFFMVHRSPVSDAWWLFIHVWCCSYTHYIPHWTYSPAVTSLITPERLWKLDEGLITAKLSFLSFTLNCLYFARRRVILKRGKKEKIVGELVRNSHCKMTMRNKAGAAQEWRGSNNTGVLESTHQSSDGGA